MWPQLTAVLRWCSRGSFRLGPGEPDLVTGVRDRVTELQGGSGSNLAVKDGPSDLGPQMLYEGGKRGHGDDAFVAGGGTIDFGRDVELFDPVENYCQVGEGEGKLRWSPPR
jgi:hypothetical protein